MSKQINLVPCAYCGAPAHPSEGWDHVYARAFFRPINLNPKNPILVPACTDCNGNKSKLETYAPLIINMAVDQISDKLKRGAEHISYNQKELLLNAEHIFAQQDDGVYLPKIKINCDWDSLNKLYEYIAMGIVYEYSGKIPVKPRFPKSTVAYIPRSDNDFITDFILSNCIYDDRRYNGKVRFAVTSNGNKALVYFQIFDVTFNKTNKTNNTYEKCDIITVVLSK